MSYSNDDDLLDIESGEDNYLSDNDDARDSDENEFAMEGDSIKNQSHEVGYVVLKEEDIRKRQKNDIEHVSALLCITQVESIALLLHYHWSVSKLQDEWFNDEDRVRKLVGLFKEPVVDYSSNGVEIDCGICFESYGPTEIASVSCGHPYCVTCWTGYTASKINDGFGCLTVKCPEPSCSAAVGQDLILKFTKEEEDKEKYYRFLLRSYVEDSGSKKRIKWCPSPGCDYAIDLSSGSDNFDVSCLCSNSFCWNCSEEAHRPVDCETVSKWIFKNNDESESTNWILANTKPCPKCKRQIEKNQGCNSMRCSQPCGHRFCWICLKAAADHHYACNKFIKPDADNDDNETEITRKRAKNAIDRYMHYYERWANNEMSRKRAMEDLEKLQSVQLKWLCQRQDRLERELEFTLEAWLQIIECRRVLKWTYAYGYYLPENEQAKREFFEYLQGEAERALEKLHHCVEKELNQFIIYKNDAPPTISFDDFRTKLIGLTKVNKTYFENLVKAWENGLEDEGFYRE